MTPSNRGAEEHHIWEIFTRTMLGSTKPLLGKEGLTTAGPVQLSRLRREPLDIAWIPDFMAHATVLGRLLLQCRGAQAMDSGPNHGFRRFLDFLWNHP